MDLKNWLILDCEGIDDILVANVVATCSFRQSLHQVLHIVLMTQVRADYSRHEKAWETSEWWLVLHSCKLFRRWFEIVNTVTFHVVHYSFNLRL